jgi:hypothetical protein
VGNKQTGTWGFRKGEKCGILKMWARQHEVAGTFEMGLLKMRRNLRIVVAKISTRDYLA